MRNFSEFVQDEIQKMINGEINFTNDWGVEESKKRLSGKYEITTPQGPFRVWIILYVNKEREILSQEISHCYYNDDYTYIHDVSLNITPMKGFYQDGWYKVHTVVYKIEDFGVFAQCEKNYLTTVEPLEEEDHIKLSNGNVLMNKFGKYEPNLCFLCEYPHIIWEDMSAKDINLDRGDFKYLRGEFFVSKKGTKCFRIKKDGKHILIRDNWGGAFNRYRGGSLPKEGSLYYRRASSNGGGSGYDYAVYPYGWQYAMSEEDI